MSCARLQFLSPLWTRRTQPSPQSFSSFVRFPLQSGAFPFKRDAATTSVKAHGSFFSRFRSSEVSFFISYSDSKTERPVPTSSGRIPRAEIRPIGNTCDIDGRRAARMRRATSWTCESARPRRLGGDASPHRSRFPQHGRRVRFYGRSDAISPCVILKGFASSETEIREKMEPRERGDQRTRRARGYFDNRRSQMAKRRS